MNLAPRQLLEISPKTLITWASDCSKAAIDTNRDRFGDGRQLDDALTVTSAWQTAELVALEESYRIVCDIVTGHLIANDWDNVPGLKTAMSVESVTSAALAAKRDLDSFEPSTVATAVLQTHAAGVTDTAPRLLRLMNVAPELSAIASTLIGDGFDVLAAIEAATTLT